MEGMFVVYINRNVKHAMIHYAGSSCVPARPAKGASDDEGWSDVFASYDEAKGYAAQQEPPKARRAAVPALQTAPSGLVVLHTPTLLRK